jgi:hypothetical protein
MSRTKRSSPQGADRTERWLGSEQAARSRRWAYEELLLGSEGGAEGSQELNALAADLAVDLAELKRMQNELHDQVVRIAGLQGRLRMLMRSSTGNHAADTDERAGTAEIPSLPSVAVRSHALLERDRSLARCEGFRVDSAAGFVGFVEGLRFLSRIDQPDLLEVRGGRFGRELLLIPIEAVEEISLAEERLLVRGTPPALDDHSHELVGRLLSALHHLVP